MTCIIHLSLHITNSTECLSTHSVLVLLGDTTNIYFKLFHFITESDVIQNKFLALNFASDTIA
jgi:hypothetical protein